MNILYELNISVLIVGGTTSLKGMVHGPKIREDVAVTIAKINPSINLFQRFYTYFYTATVSLEDYVCISFLIIFF